jgi:hypothetical protein
VGDDVELVGQLGLVRLDGDLEGLALVVRHQPQRELLVLGGPGAVEGDEAARPDGRVEQLHVERALVGGGLRARASGHQQPGDERETKATSTGESTKQGHEESAGG